MQRSGAQSILAISSTECSGNERPGDSRKPFTQVNSSTTRAVGGTGPGLTVGCRMVQSMCGEVNVATETRQPVAGVTEY